jgi:hypothetical protein
MSTLVIIFTVIWMVITAGMFIVGAITNPDKYKDCVGDLQKFTETYVKSVGQIPAREIESEHNGYVIYFSLKKYMRSAVVKFIVFIGIFMMFFMPTQKQIIMIVSAPYIVDYVVNVKKDFNDNGTTQDIVQIPRKFIESFGVASDYISDYFKTTTTKQPESNKVEQQTSVKLDYKTLEQISSVVTKKVLEAVAEKK